MRAKLDDQGEAVVSTAPDLEDLNRYMWNLDAPYKNQPTKLDGIAIEARGRSAVMLWEWLDGYVADKR